MKTSCKLILVAVTAVFMPAITLAQAAPAPNAQQAPPPRGPQQKDMVLDQARRAEVLERLIAGLNGYYVFPDHAKAMAADLRARDQRGEYAKLTSAEAFAEKLTEDLQSTSKDRHIEVAYSERPFPPQ